MSGVMCAAKIFFYILHEDSRYCAGRVEQPARHPQTNFATPHHHKGEESTVYPPQCASVVWGGRGDRLVVKIDHPTNIALANLVL